MLWPERTMCRHSYKSPIDKAKDRTPSLIYTGSSNECLAGMIGRRATTVTLNSAVAQRFPGVKSATAK
jgi:hypothetical protein